MGKSRIEWIDWVRGLCMLWIVGVWHMSGYLGVSLSSEVFENITTGALAMFTLIAGYFAANHEFLGKNSIQQFYVTKFLRIYPLLAISCISAYIFHLLKSSFSFITSLKQLLFTLLGISCLSGIAPLTFWYISMLIMLYVLTPVLFYSQKNISRISILILMSTLWISYSISSCIDERLLIYIPFYLIGGMLSKGKYAERPISRKTSLVLSCSSSILFIACSIGGGNSTIPYCWVAGVLFCIAIAMLGISMSSALEHSRLSKLMQALSYASFCAYLFHRHIYSIGNFVFGQYSIPVAFIMFICCIVIAYIIQYAYNGILRCMRMKFMFMG